MVKSSIKISVLTCCYNAYDFIDEAIESIFNQSYKEFEYVIVDDGSTDNTFSILKRYAAKDKRIVLIEKEHSGLTTSLNVGLEQAKGEWIARLDADDIAMPERLSDQLNFVEDNERVVLLGGGCIEIDKNGTIIKKHIYPQEHNTLMDRLENRKAFFPHSSAFFHKASVMKLGGYNPRFTRSQDLDLWLRVGDTARIACLNHTVVKLRKHSEMTSNTNGGRLQQVMSLCARICHFHRKVGLSDPSQMEEDVWQGFLKWVEKQMEEEGLFQFSQGWQALRNVWYKNPKANKFKKGSLLMKELIHNLLARKALWRRFGKENLVIKLAKESRKIL